MFMDIDEIPLCAEFVEATETTVAKCDVLIAVIGKNWLISKDDHANRRLDDPADFVRKEIGAALKRNIRVIPVLVDGASMPRWTDLPDDLKPLVRRNALKVSDDRFGFDSGLLVDAIKEVLEEANAERRQKERLEAEQREKERLEAEQREKERLEAALKQREEQGRVGAERRQRERVASETPSEAILDENIQFTTYRPPAIDIDSWYQLLVFTHVEARLGESDVEDQSLTEEMEELARQILGSEFPQYRETTDESRLSIPRESEITFVPEIEGLEFYPPTQSFLWAKDIRVHPETFWFRAQPESLNKVLRGRLSAFLGHILLAEIILSIRVIGRVESLPSSLKTSSTRVYRKIFASYSHDDSEIVEATVVFVRTLGDEYLRDVINLRAGENWNRRLLEFIDKADVFQLFWSVNSAKSEFVEKEWRYALELKREAFVRPTYWQTPMPKPPALLEGIHFYKMPFLLTGEPRPPAQPIRQEGESREHEEKQRRQVAELESQRRENERLERPKLLFRLRLLVARLRVQLTICAMMVIVFGIWFAGSRRLPMASCRAR